MTYPDNRAQRFAGEGLRVEPEYRQASGTPEGFPDDIDPITMYTPETQLALNGPRALTAAELDGAFDDPEQGEPGRDRFGVHWIWELVLLLGCVGLAFVVASHAGALSGVNLRTLMVEVAIFGVVALGAGLSLRAGAVNLAVGPIFVLAGLYYAQHSSSGFYAAAGSAAGIALGCGLVLGLVVTIFHVPGWAAGLAAAFGIGVWEASLPQTAVLSTHYNPAAHGYYWLGGFVLIALIGSILGAVRPIRRSVGRFRPVGDPAIRRGVPAAVMTTTALAGSGLLAGVAGIAFTMYQGAATSSDGVSLTGVAVGIALLGGTSAYGRRGGIFGTILATVAFVLATDYVTLHGWRGGETLVIASGLGLGLLVTRLVETAGRPDQTVVVEDRSSTLSWLGRQQGSWTRELPAGPEEPTWEEDPEERWRTR